MNCRNGWKIGLIVALVAETLYGCSSTMPAGAPGPTPAIGSGAVAESPADSDPVAIQLGAGAYDLAYDPAADRIWAALLRSGEPDELIEFDPAVGSIVSTTKLPDADYNGFLSRIKIGPDGSVWISQPYRLIRYGPNSGVDALSFDVDVEGADADALDPANPLVGTWISAIGFSGTRVLVARANVPSLTVVDGQLAVQSEIPLPSNASGLSDIASGDSNTFLAGTLDNPGSVWRLTDGVARLVESKADRLESFGGSVIGSGAGSSVIDVATGEGVASGVSGESGVRVSSDPSTGSLVVFDPALGALLRISNGSVADSITLPMVEASVSNPHGVAVPVIVKVSVSDLVVDVRGTVWYLSGSSLRSAKF